MVGIASSGTARKRAVPGAYLSTCGVTRTSGASAPPDCGVRETQLVGISVRSCAPLVVQALMRHGASRAVVLQSPWDGARYHIGCHYEERSDEIIPR